MMLTLKLRLLARGLKQYDVARLAGMTETKLSRLIRGRATATADERRRLAAAIGLSERALFPEVARVGGGMRGDQPARNPATPERGIDVTNGAAAPALETASATIETVIEPSRTPIEPGASPVAEGVVDVSGQYALEVTVGLQAAPAPADNAPSSWSRIDDCDGVVEVDDADPLGNEADDEADDVASENHDGGAA